MEDAASAYTFLPEYAGYRAPQPDSVENNIEVIDAELKEAPPERDPDNSQLPIPNSQ